MPDKINIIQFMPYYPPHKGGVEIVGRDIWINWIKNDYWEFINIVSSFWQWEAMNMKEKIFYEDEVIWYINNGVKVIVIPSFELVWNFPMYSMWKRRHMAKKYLFDYVRKWWNWKILTHTRFFWTTFYAWRIAKKNKLDWIHIEHGSSFVEFWSKIKSYIWYSYDKLIWWWCLRNANKVLAISKASKKFIVNNFWRKDVEVYYRWIDAPEKIDKKQKWIKFVFVWRLIKQKWIYDLIEAYKNLKLKNELIIIWDWEERKWLEDSSKWYEISFMWNLDNIELIDFLASNNLIIINPSYSEGMPSTVIEWLLTKNLVIASNVWWTAEISNKKDLILFNAWDKKELEKKYIHQR